MPKTSDRDALLRYGDMIDIGGSDGHKCRHDWKTELTENGIYKSSEQAKIIPITNTKTLERYKTTLDEISKNLATKGISGGLSMLSPETAKEFLIDKANAGLSRQTCKDYCSHLTKISTMINNVNAKISDIKEFAESRGYSHDIRELTPEQRQEYITERGITGDARAYHDAAADENGPTAAERYIDGLIEAFGANSINVGLSDSQNVDFTRVQTEFRKETIPNLENTGKVVKAFANPKAVIENIRGKNAVGAKLAAEIQLKTGLRSENALKCRLNGDGTIAFTSKGGMPHNRFMIPSDLYNRLKAFDRGGGRVVIMSDRTYRDAIRKAAVRTGEDLRHASATHSFRHAYAKNLYNDLICKGIPKIEAKGIVSEALFHKRLDVVERYLK